MEQKQADLLGRSRYERQPARRGHRNGYAKAALKTAEGCLDVALPQVQGTQQPFRSRLMALLGEHTDLLERLAVETDARGLSTRVVEERRRTKVIPRFRSEKSYLKLVFATLIQASRRWSLVRMTERHQAQLERLWLELGQTPPPPTSQERGKLAS